MMSYQYIRQLADEAARKAKRNGRTPVAIGALGDDAIRAELKRMPFLGTYIPAGFEHVHVGDTFGGNAGIGTADDAYLLVDSSGWGTPGELAHTFEQFCELVQRHPGYSYAIAEAGEFQVVVGVYRAKTKTHH